MAKATTRKSGEQITSATVAPAKSTILLYTLPQPSKLVRRNSTSGKPPNKSTEKFLVKVWCKLATKRKLICSSLQKSTSSVTFSAEKFGLAKITSSTPLEIVPPQGLSGAPARA